MSLRDQNEQLKRLIDDAECQNGGFEVNGLVEVIQTITDNIDSWATGSISGLRFFHLNVRSLNKNWDELKIVLTNQIGKFSVLLLSEVSVNVHKSVLSYYSLHGYSLYHKTRNGKRGGGLFMYIRSNISVKVDEKDFKNFEGLCCTLQINDPLPFRIRVLAVYRPPNSSRLLFTDEIKKYLQSDTYVNSIVLGDINLDLNNNGDHDVSNYEQTFAANGFTKCISANTREEVLTGNITSSCIDHIFVRSKATQINSVVVKSKISDHYITGVTFEMNRNVSKSHEYCHKIEQINLKRFNEGILKIALLKCDWDSVLDVTDTVVMYDLITEMFNNCYCKASIDNNKRPDRHTRFQQPWITNDIKSIIKERDRAFQKWKKGGHLFKKVNLEEYKNVRKQVGREIRKAKAAFYKDKFEYSKGDIKLSWRYINEMLGRKRNMSVDETINRYLGQRFSDEVIAENFVNSFVKEVKLVQHDCDITVFSESGNNAAALQSMYLSPVKDFDVSDAILKMDVKKAPGVDGIRVKDLQLLCKQISPIIARLINLTVQNSVVPAGLKLSIVRPVHKKENHMNFSNYRPISILPMIEKIMERCVASKLSLYLAKYNLVSENQYGF
jgi:hypothetical protein